MSPGWYRLLGLTVTNPFPKSDPCREVKCLDEMLRKVPARA